MSGGLPTVVDLSEALRRDVDLLGDWDDEPADDVVKAPVPQVQAHEIPASKPAELPKVNKQWDFFDTPFSKM
jgi:hypothetical protein